jgi:hypothetical protein
LLKHWVQSPQVHCIINTNFGEHSEYCDN